MSHDHAILAREIVLKESGAISIELNGIGKKYSYSVAHFLTSNTMNNTPESR